MTGRWPRFENTRTTTSTIMTTGTEALVPNIFMMTLALHRHMPPRLTVAVSGPADCSTGSNSTALKPLTFTQR